ncbi:MAG: hypothetical protein II656_02200 [Ruminococcus sp.]|nr:hypothetical protein [Ruminococcus sp.]
MKNSRHIAFVTALIMTLSAVSCGSKSSDKSDVSSTSSSEVNTDSTKEETSTENSTETASESTSAAQSQTTTVTTKSAAAVTTTAAVTTAPNNEKKPQPVADDTGYKDKLAIAQEFYKSYLSHDAEKVYSMFNIDEINGYYILMKNELDGKKPEEVFSKAVIVAAIDRSMKAIDEIREAYADSKDDKWAVDITNDDMSDIDQLTLEDYNSELGTKYTSGVVLNYIFYHDTNNNESFTGNSSAFVERDGKWYLSFSSLMQSELLNYIDL